ncbi:MAG: Fe-S cluster assembly protein SufD [Candidatus Latescibacterota bacterium]|nr:MAG: Fe-S cluster assembly protein SufD [Candidatus Latescibacterota bacterium]
MADKETYISKFAELETKLSETAPSWVHDIRKSAIDRFAEQGFPTTKNEQWRFTRVRPLLRHDFEPVLEYEQDGLPARKLDELCIEDTGCRRVTFVNGHFAADLSDLGKLPKGVRIESLQKALQTDPERVQRHLSKYADTGNNPFVALNTAHLIDGTFIYLPKDTRVKEPIHLLHVTRSNAKPILSHPRILIVAEANTRASIVESYIGFDADTYFTNPVTEITVMDRAEIDHCKLQKESAAAYHMGTVQVHLGRDSRFKTDFISIGGTLVRNDVNAVLDDEGIECSVNGLYLANGHQHIDNHTLIEHAKPHCTSNELFKGILSDRAKAVFNGRIHVHPDAQKTDARQTNRCILLSDDAQINTNPQLEIYADDVKCTHGAAVGQIDENAVFYLRSRGIEKSAARQMLIEAFAAEVLEGIKINPVRERLTMDIIDWFTKARGAGKAD